MKAISVTEYLNYESGKHSSRTFSNLVQLNHNIANVSVIELLLL